MNRSFSDFRGIFYFFHRDILSESLVSDKPGTVQGEISKIYVDKNSIKTAPNNNDIRYFSIKEVHSNPKNNVVKNNLAIECSQGLFLSPFTNQWEPIFQRGYIIGTLKTYEYYSYTTVCDDVRGKYSNNIIINTNRIGF
ncbi:MULTISPECIES: hypothetical protein [Acinetobacter]|uniref:hypothetical protein n=2 Tax=Moraxellaceae TaxID=468 RepID=UPI0013D6E5E1|nr:MULTISPECIES: hypothetical protein [Acinetobacter]MDM1782798.1 hypothetical protein [Acinetobacter indicus]